MTSRSRIAVVLFAAAVLLVWPRLRPLACPIMGVAPAIVLPPWEGALARDISPELRKSPRGGLLMRGIQQLLHGDKDALGEAANALAECIGEESDEISWRAASALAEALMERRTSMPRLISDALVKGLRIRPSQLPESERGLIDAWEPLLHEALGAGARWERGTL